MKKLYAWFLILAMLLASFAQAEATAIDTEALLAENETLKARVSKLESRLNDYADPDVIAVFDGGHVTFGEVYMDYMSVLSTYSLFFEQDIANDPALRMDVQKMLIDDVIRSRLIALHAEMNGISLLSAEQEAQLIADADNAYNDILNDYTAIFLENSSVDDAIAQATISLENENITPENMRELYLNEARMENACLLFTEDVTVSDDEVRSCYDMYLAEQKEYYTQYPAEFAWHNAGEVTIWAPEGYRIARAILVPFTDEEQAAYDELLTRFYDATDENELESIQTEMDRIYAAMAPRADAVCARLAAGEPFDALMNEFAGANEALGDMGAAEGFLVSKDSWGAIAEAVMSIEKIGGISEPSEYSEGMAIYEYYADVPSGNVPYESVYEQIRDSALSDKRAAAFDKMLNDWMAEADIAYLLNRMDA